MFATVAELCGISRIFATVAELCGISRIFATVAELCGISRIFATVAELCGISRIFATVAELCGISRILAIVAELCGISMWLGGGGGGGRYILSTLGVWHPLMRWYPDPLLSFLSNESLPSFPSTYPYYHNLPFVLNLFLIIVKIN